jgi:hypothetical protein
MQVSIHRLPYEVLQSIFLITVSERVSRWPYDIPFTQPSILSEVCYRWYTICRDTGSLWTFVDFTQGNIIASHSLQRSKGRPLSLYLNLEYDRDNREIPQLFAASIPSLANLHTLAIEGSSTSLWKFIPLYLSHFPARIRPIKNLCLHVNYVEGEILPNPQALDMAVQSFLDSFEVQSVVDLKDVAFPPLLRGLIVLRLSIDSYVSADQMDECLGGCPMLQFV